MDKCLVVVKTDNVESILDSADYDVCVLLRDPDGTRLSEILDAEGIMRKSDNGDRRGEASPARSRKPVPPKSRTLKEGQQPKRTKPPSKDKLDRDLEFRAAYKDLCSSVVTKEQFCKTAGLSWKQVQEKACRLRKKHGAKAVPYYTGSPGEASGKNTGAGGPVDDDELIWLWKNYVGGQISREGFCELARSKFNTLVLRVSKLRKARGLEAVPYYRQAS